MLGWVTVGNLYFAAYAGRAIDVAKLLAATAEIAHHNNPIAAITAWSIALKTCVRRLRYAPRS